MKNVLIGLIALGTLPSFAGNDCRTKFQEYKTKQIYESVAPDWILGGTMYGGLAVGGIVEATGALGTAATLGSTLSIASFFIPMTIYGGIEGGIALVNAPHTKAINLIDQSYQFKESKNYTKTKLLKRIARKLGMTNEDLAATIIRSNEDGSLCATNKTKKDILGSIKRGDITVVDVEDSTYSGDALKWTCAAQTKYYQGSAYQGSANTKRMAKKNALAACSEATGVKCKFIVTCDNHESGMSWQRF